MGTTSHRRSFVILKSRDDGFEFPGQKEPSGYVKIDIKSNRVKFFTYIQDLLPQISEQGKYEIYVVLSGKGKKPHKLAEISIDSRGRAESSVEVDFKNIGQTNNSTDDIKAIFVVYKNFSQPDRLWYPLTGYSNKREEIDLSGQITIDILNSQNVTSPVKKQIVLKERETERESVSETSISVTEEQKALQIEPIIIGTTHDEQEQIEQTYIESMQPEFDLEQPVDEAQHKECKEIFDKIAVGDYDVNPELNYWDKVRNYFIKMFGEHDRIYPFGYNDAIKWVRIDLETGQQPQYADRLRFGDYYIANTCFRDLFNKAHHLVGLAEFDGKVSYVIYGVPGVYNERLSTASTQGLSKWAALNEGCSFGYWLTYIDALTGDIVQANENQEL